MPIRQASAPLPVFFTDPRVELAAIARTVRRLPKGAWMVFRHYTLVEAERAALFATLRRAARRRGVQIILAAAEPVRFADADGWHKSGWRGHTPRRAPPLSASAHSFADLTAARHAGARAVFISPVFATNSHKGARALGPLSYQRMAIRARALGLIPLPLGGMTAARARMLRAKGFGAIDGLVRR